MLDLFSGIGGFALAASWVWADDLELQGFCEIDNYCQKVLKKNFPDVPIYDDITELQPEWFDDIDLLTGGFPCQDISVAGKGEGLEGDRSGLWFEMLRLISGIRPRYALIENVPMLLHRGLGRVICDLASIGYDAEWQVVSAADVGAPHLRKRIWIVAYAGHLRRGNHVGGDVGLRGRQQAQTAIRSASQSEITGSSQESEAVAYPKSELWEEQRKPLTTPPKYETPGCGSWWLTEPDVGRVADGVPKRVDRLRGLGNAIVPHCAALIMDRIKAAG
jgi:DNA (cytosine-5)-methyltransferase 1